MEKETSSDVMESPSMMMYVIGAVLVVAVIGGAWYFRSKSPSTAVVDQTQQQQPVASPTPGPITKLSCDTQYFNPKIGFPEYYLSVEGGDVNTAKTVSCEFTAKVNGNIVATASGVSPLSDAPQRGGATFRCTTKAVALTPGVLTTVNVALTDDAGKTASCSAPFTFPKP